MEYVIHGTVMPVVELTLAAGESVYTESGGMAWYKGDIEMKTEGRGGLGAMIGRKLAGESAFMTSYTCRNGQASIIFSLEAPGKIIPFQLAAGQSIIAQKDSFMCAEQSVKLEMHFRKRLGAGIFGGEGFILQKLTGPGMVFCEIDGEVMDYTLAAGETMKVDPGHLALYEPTIDYDIERVKGIRNIFFGGEGLFLGTLKGPGKVWLQTMPLTNLAMAIRRFFPTS